MAAGADETKLTREALKWPYGEFEIPNEVYDAFGAAGKKGKAIEEEWNKVQTASDLLPVIEYCKVLIAIASVHIPVTCEIHSICPGEQLFKLSKSSHTFCA